MYTKMTFGKELKNRLESEQSVNEIAHWSYDVYLGETDDDNNSELDDILLILNCMDNGSEFEISYKRLNEIADDLIAGKKDINMDY